MPDFAVSVAIRGDDELSGNLRRLSKRVDRFGRNASRSFGRAAKSAGMFRAVLGGTLAAGAISRGFTALNMGVGATVRGFVDMDQALVSAGAKFQLAKLGSEQAAAAMQSLNDAARKTGAETEFTATQAAQGLEFLAMAGFNAEQAIASLPVMVNLATATNTDLARASDIASDAIGAFGLASEDAAVQASNLNRITDVFSLTTASANVDMENLFESMKAGGPIFTTAGQSLESFATMAAIMGNAGIKGSLAGTVMKRTIEQLVAPSGKAEKTLKSLGVQVADSGGNMRDVADILSDFNDATKDMGDAQRTAAISTIFGSRAVSGISKILDEGIPSLRKYREGLKAAEGTTDDMAEVMRKSLGNRLKVINSSLLELGFKVMEAFDDKFPGALDSAMEAIRNFNVGRLVDILKGITVAVKAVWDWMKKWKVAIYIVVAALGVLKIALALTGAVELFTAVVTGATTISKAWAGSQWAVNAAMYANPITLVIALIIALIAVIVLVIIYWDELVAAWQNGLDAVVSGTNDATNWVADMFAELATPVTNTAIAISNAFGEAWHGIKSGVAATIKFVVGAWRKMQSALGFDTSGTWTDADIDKWFGTDQEYKPLDYVSFEETARTYRDLFKDAASSLGGTAQKKEATPAPNKARVEAQQQSIDLRGQIDVFSPQGFQTQGMSTESVNGKKSNAINWRQKAGKNGGA